MAHFVLTDFLELSLEEMPANLTTYPAGIPATAPSALTASMHLGVLPDVVSTCLSLHTASCKVIVKMLEEPNLPGSACSIILLCSSEASYD